MTDKIKIVCTDPGPFHERYGRTVVGTFTQAPEGHPWRWVEEKLDRDAARWRKHPGALLGLDHASTIVQIKPSRVTGMGRNSQPAPKRTLGSPHVDLPCKGCRLHRRVRGEDLWPIFDDLAARGRIKIELRELITRINDTRKQ